MTDANDPLVRGHLGLTGERLEATHDADRVIRVLQAGGAAYLRLPMNDLSVDLHLTKVENGRLYYFNPLPAAERKLKMPTRRVEQGNVESVQQGALIWTLRDGGGVCFVEVEETSDEAVDEA